MTPDRSGLWFFRETTGLTHDRVARVQFFTPDAEKVDRPGPGIVVRVGLMTGDILLTTDLGPDREWLGPVAPRRAWTAVEDDYPDPEVPVEVRYIAAHECDWRSGNVGRCVAFQDPTFREHGIAVSPERSWTDDRSGERMHRDAHRVTHWRHLDDGPT